MEQLLHRTADESTYYAPPLGIHAWNLAITHHHQLLFLWAAFLQWSPSIGGAKMWLVAFNERDVWSFRRLHQLLAQSLQRCRSRRACVCASVNIVCVCIYVCMYVCVWTCIYVYICKCVCMGIHMHVYTGVYVCVCMFVHRFWVSVAILQRVWAVS